MGEEIADVLARGPAAGAFGIGRWSWDLGSQTVHWSPEQRALFGLSGTHAEFSVYSFCEMVHPDDRPRVMATVSETLSLGREGHSHGFRIIRPDGAVRLLLSRARLERDAAGLPCRLHGIDLDITDTQHIPKSGTASPKGVRQADHDRHVESRDEHSALLRVALDAGRMAVWQLDLKRQMVTLDENIARMFGVPGLARQLPLGFIDTLVEPRDLPVVVEARTAALRGEAVQAEFRIRLANGRHRWLRSLGAVQSDAAGQPGHIVGVLYDISARKEAEARLRESEEHYRDVFSAIDEGFCICDMITDADGNPVDYRFIEANPLFEAMTGLSGAIGRTALELVPDLERHWIDTYARVGLGGEKLRFELPSDALGRWFNVFATPLSVPGRFALVFKDVTERKRGEDALAESEARFRTVTEAMPQMVWSARPDGWNDFYNQQWRDFLGAAPEPALAGDGWRTCFHPDDHAEIERRWSHALSTGETYEIECRLLHHADGYRWILARSVPVRDEAGNILRWLGTCTDIHDMKLSQQRQQLLLEEMEHRVKNIMALVQAVARQTFSMIPDAAEARESFAGRLRVLSDAYSHLNHENWSQASLRHIILTSLRGCGARPETTSLEGPDLMLPPKTAVTLSMAIHELCTNAVKYGALSVPGGHASIRWNVSAEDRLQLVWHEEGGPPVEPPSRRGFGTRMIESALAAEMDGTVRLVFAPAGVLCEMEAHVDLHPNQTG